ncbi:MAG: hypothetical protein A3D44_01560 [Candidatus Staskawiczbacteria bacterium RIFCSPHIGHO2_02_FULL_42_22]|uniref:DUF5679 domain-containing protein n=1 Tax=Candidatus Staskawiczbacteria bacterium RIFCSPHIGHO2_02_FULL_42_22 TaxID=1802207 RepID=A0A1G2HZH3_9BACT|nr:MAG: hypothetical protein A3D44_01560 [Candidatus Staskawiczbacteria bacterium RIFCSPHIGHO2_02_FULL_42_22]
MSLNRAEINAEQRGTVSVEFRVKFREIPRKQMATEAYCVKCKAKRLMKDEKEVAMKGKGGTERRAMTGTCEKCGTKMFRIMGAKK